MREAVMPALMLAVAGIATAATISLNRGLALELPSSTVAVVRGNAGAPTAGIPLDEATRATSVYDKVLNDPRYAKRIA